MKTTNKLCRMLLAGLLLAGIGARASISIPDGNPLGVTSTTTLSGLNSSISSVSVILNITGPNPISDFYGYLSYDGHLVTLVYEPGVTPSNPLGYLNQGYNNITLMDSASGGSIQSAGSYSSTAQVTGSYYADSGSTAFGTAYDGLNPNGTWTLFFADLSGGDPGNSQLTWSLDVTAVPEPVNVALAVFALLAIVISVVWRLVKMPGNFRV